MATTQEFIEYLKGTTFVEYNNLDVLVAPEETQNKRNIYFCCGLGTKLSKRCGDDDIKLKKYFYVDIDIRLTHYKKTGEVISQTDMTKEIEKILKLIDYAGFDDYSALVDSGNGLHIYYVGTERAFDKKVYTAGVNYIYNQIDAIIQETGYSCDPAISNIARIARLPGTLNPRIKQRKNLETKEMEVLWDLGDIECQIIKFTPQISLLFEGIESFAIEYQQELEKDKEAQQQIRLTMKNDYKKSEDIRQQINSIPAHEIASDIRGVRIIDRGLDNVALSEGHKNMGAYRYKPHNVIVNTGSSLIKTQKSYFTPYELVYYELMEQDKKKTVDYFKDKYHIEVKPDNKTMEIPKIQYEKQGYLYPNSVFDAFDCVMSGELMTVVAASNSGKTTFAMDIIQVNANRGKKCYYINLEFPIETMREGRWLFINNKKKRNLTDIAPLSDEDRTKMNIYVQQKLKQFDYHNNPNGMSIEDIVQMIIEKHKQGYGLFVIDTFSRITGNLNSATAHTSQNKTMEILQELCQNLGVVVMLLHHTNKNGVFEGTQKIMDLSNVFVMISKDEDMSGNAITKFILTKDKFVSRIELDTYYVNHEYTLDTPKYDAPF